VNDADKLLAAWHRGHFWNPAKPDVLNVTDESAVQKLTIDHPIAQQAFQSWQEADANFDTLVLAWHKRPPHFDGVVGPATEQLIELPRCPLPDFPPPPNASFDYGDAGLNAAVESMRANASGSGSWPMPGCDPDRQGVHSIRVRLPTNNQPSTVTGYRQKALEACSACYAEIGLAVKYITEGDCEIAKLWQSLGGSIIGWNEFPSPDTCNQTINGRMDIGYAPSDYRLWANLEVHETGHGVGLQHTRGHIMNPSILLVWPLTWKGGPSESTISRYFGGEPLTPVTPPPPTPPPPPGGDPWAGSSITVNQPGKPPRRFIPAIEV
jgi:hypothetical protein